MKPAKSFNNIIIGQFALTGVPLKVYVNNRYLTITDPDDIEDPLIGFGMTDNGEMIKFAYPEVEHLSVSGNSVTIDTYNKGMEPEEPETPAEPKEEKPKEEKPKEKEKKGPPGMSDHYMPKLKDLVEMTNDELKAALKSAKADMDAGKAKIKAAKEKERDLKSQPIDDSVEEDEYEDLVAEASIHDLEELDKGDIVIDEDGDEWTIEKIRWWLGSPDMTLRNNTDNTTTDFPEDYDDPNFFASFNLKESVNEAKEKWVVYDTKTKKRLPNAGKTWATMKAANEFAAKQKNAEVASEIWYFDKIKESVNEDHIDTISEPYMFKVGDIIHDKDLGCKHHGSKGIVITADPDSVRYTVTNDGNFFKPGDILQKVVDQLELA